MSVLSPPTSEAVERFACFGGDCSVLVQGAGPAGSASLAAQRTKSRLLEWHSQFSRFDPASELSDLNQDPRQCVPVSGIMAGFVEAAIHAAALTGGLVDPTLVTEVEEAGYRDDFVHPRVARVDAARLAPPARPAAPDPRSRWQQVTVDRGLSAVIRPSGVRLDSGGVAKGFFCDVLAGPLSWHDSFAVAAAGDIRFGGAAGIVRPIEVRSPFDERGVLHTFELARGAAATSGTTRRAWIDPRGRLAHHILDPATGRPAFTGVVQVTALAASGLEAEALAKAALLAGRDRAAEWLPHGGLVVYDDGGFDVIGPPEGEAST
jgi:thiamine biosynthesis lipoprotein